MNEPNLIVIAGPTASGKTALAVALAERIGGEVVNADSMQVYKYMDIGTAKPSLEERRGIPHHLMDIVEPDCAFSVAQYCELAHRCIREVQQRGKMPVLVGGTGLYIDAVVQNIQFCAFAPDLAYRAGLEAEDSAVLYERLKQVDPDSAGRIAPADRKRLIRALEVFHTTGRTMSWHQAQSRAAQSPYRARVFGIATDRAELYERINKRVDGMMAAGLEEEVRRLLEMGVPPAATSMQAIGYKELAAYLRQDCSKEQAVEAVRQNSRRYAKRQLTWFRRNADMLWIDNRIETLCRYL